MLGNLGLGCQTWVKAVPQFSIHGDICLFLWSVPVDHIAHKRGGLAVASIELS